MSTIQSSNLKNNHRQIYIKHFGPIPIDEYGQTYEIHHIDGDHYNNDPTNLKAVTIKEHYDIHYAQCDYAACLYISARMTLTKEQKSELARKAALKRVEDGTHNFFDPEIARRNSIRMIEEGRHAFPGGEMQRRTQKERVSNGTHHLLSGEIQKESNKKRVANGTHNFLGGEIQRQAARRQIENGTHSSQKVRTCPYCGKTGRGPSMITYHFDKCKTLKNK